MSHGQAAGIVITPPLCQPVANFLHRGGGILQELALCAPKTVTFSLLMTCPQQARRTLLPWTIWEFLLRERDVAPLTGTSSLPPAAPRPPLLRPQGLRLPLPTLPDRLAARPGFSAE